MFVKRNQYQLSNLMSPEIIFNQQMQYQTNLQKES